MKQVVTFAWARRELERLVPRSVLRVVMEAAGQVPRPFLAGVAAVGIWVLIVAAMPTDKPSNGGLAGAAAVHSQKDTLAIVGRSNVLRIYMDPVGSDGNSGATPEQAIRSLARAQEVLAAAQPKTDVEVRIKSGVYVAPPVKWSTYVPDHTITFLPIDYEYGEGHAGISSRPIFKGDGSTGFWFRAQPQQGHQGDTRLGFYFLQVEGYSAGGLTFDGGASSDGTKALGQDSSGVNGNTVYGMVFRNFGSKHVPSGVGYGAIDLVNSRNNVIEGNRFTDLENAGGTRNQALIHGVYLSHYSSGNLVSDNHFYRISGDPIRTRNGSGRNKIYGNTFERTGSNAYFSDWYAAGSGAHGEGAGGECASIGNSFYNNDLISGYRGRVKVWWISPTDPDHAGRCGGGEADRVRTWGNRTR